MHGAPGSDNRNGTGFKPTEKTHRVPHVQWKTVARAILVLDELNYSTALRHIKKVH